MDVQPDEDFYSHCPNGVPEGFVGTTILTTGLTILPQDVPTDVIRANVTAFCGGIWLAGGSTAGGGIWLNNSCTAASIDGGETWHVVTQAASA